MSGQTHNGQHVQNEHVIDEDKNVDSRLKRQIVDLRKEVRKAERVLFVEADADPEMSISQPKRVNAWGTVVKQYLRMIEPLLRADTIEQSEEYYQEVELGSLTLVPQDTNEYQFSLAAHSNLSDDALRREIGLPRGTEIPQPKTVPFNGLVSLIGLPSVLTQEWAVEIREDGNRRRSSVVRTSDQRIVPRGVYETAFRKANLFLQKAGVGLDVDDDSLPAITNFDMSRDSNDAELTQDKHETPEI